MTDVYAKGPVIKGLRRETMERFEAIGRELARRGGLAPGMEAATFAACRAYADRVAGLAPYDLLCPVVVRAEPAEALALEAAMTVGPPAPAALPPVARTVSPPPALKNNGDLAWAYGYHRLGPIIAAFAHWVDQLAFARHQPKAVIMRDGGFFGAALRILRPDDPPSELWLSRRVCLTGAIAGADDREGLTNLLIRARGQPISVAQAATELGLAGCPLPAQLPPERILSAATLEPFLDWLARPTIKPILADHCQAVRAAILGHLRRQNVLRDGMVRLVMVDVGYAGSVQRALSTLLRLEDIPCALSGAYLLTTPGLLWTLREGGPAAGFLAHLGAPSWLARPFIRSREVFESFCATPWGPLQGYDSNGGPVLAPSVLPPAQLAEVARLQQGALAFCATAEPPLSSAEARQAALALIEAPRPEEARMIGRWLYDDTLAIGQPRSLTAPGTTAARPVLWPQGARAMAVPVIAQEPPWSL